jgi:hypothetical protein
MNADTDASDMIKGSSVANADSMSPRVRESNAAFTLSAAARSVTGPANPALAPLQKDEQPTLMTLILAGSANLSSSSSGTEEEIDPFAIRATKQLPST